MPRAAATASTTPHTRARARQTAEASREAILEAAMAEFAITGLHGTSTEAIARRAGVSQPYIFRLYGTKKNLYLASIERGFERVLETFQRVAADSKEPFHDMGQAYVALLEDRELLLAQMQSYAACSDADVQELVRTQYGRLFNWLRTVPGATDEAVRGFLATGMLLNVAAAMDLPAVVSSSDWAAACLGMPWSDHAH
jgi:AcrR family transcriptional regulator